MTLAQPARRVVTLAPFLTELAFSAGAGDRVVGKSAFSDFPAAAKRLPEVSSALGPSLEAVAAVQPDLALAWRDSIRDEDVTRLEALGIPVFIAQARSLADPPRLLRAVAVMLGGNDAAGRDYRERIATQRRKHAALVPMTALIAIGFKPLMTLAGPHWVNDAAQACGVRNAFEDLPGIAPAVPWELVIAREPSLVVGAGSASNDAAFREQWKDHDEVAAVRAGRLAFVDADLLLRPSLRLADGIDRLCAQADALREGRAVTSANPRTKAAP